MRPRDARSCAGFSPKCFLHRLRSQQSLTRDKVELQPYSVWILEQQRVIYRRPLILARRANDLHVKRTQEAVQLVNVGALAGAKAQMVQADAILLERGAGVRPPTQ